MKASRLAAAFLFMVLAVGTAWAEPGYSRQLNSQDCRVLEEYFRGQKKLSLWIESGAVEIKEDGQVVADLSCRAPGGVVVFSLEYPLGRMDRQEALEGE